MCMFMGYVLNNRRILGMSPTCMLSYSMYCFQFKQIVMNHCLQKYFKLVDKKMVYGNFNNCRNKCNCMPFTAAGNVMTAE